MMMWVIARSLLDDRAFDRTQLQPVPNKVPRDASLDAIRNFGWAFETSDWSDIFKPENSFVLEKVYRQDDEAFVQTLNRIRTGDAVDGRRALRELVDECSRQLACPDGIRPTMVYTTNDVIDQVNQGELAKLSSPLRTFSAKDTNAVSPDVATAQASLAAAALARDPFYKNCPATQSLALKVGAQVMLTRNIDVARGLCNGSRGVVVDFEPGPGGGGNTAAAMLPVVKFISGQVATIEMMTYEHEVAGLGTCRRLQLPLKLAWAISTHKSQGMTLDLAVVSLDNVFAYGQAYVALSRARSKAGMQIVGWDGKFKAADASVARFYEGVRSGAPAEPSERWLAYADVRGWLMPKDTCLIVPSSDEEGEG
jgi:ATP-dependent DNA helicase PIF1